MAKRFTGIGVVVVLAAIGGLGALGACNSSSDDTADCTTLSACCAQVSDASNKSECTTIVSQGDPANCAAVQSTYEGAKLCTVTTDVGGGGGATGCAGLTACCSSLSATYQGTCAEEVSASQGVDANCSTFLQEYVSTGMCAASTGGGGGTGCTGLSTCCAALPAAEQSGCEAIVSEGSDTTCTEELSAYTSAGLCSGGGGTGTGTGTGGTGCSGLSSCCGSLPAAEQSGCDSIVSEGSDTTCTEELSAYMAAGYCGGGTGTGTGTGGTGCSGLSSCCGSLPAAEQSGCDSIVSEGSDTTCTEELSAYMAAGYCGGGAGSGTGTSGTGCASLSSCCSTLPAAEAPGCDSIVSEGSDTTCTEELSAYMASGFCG